jgi:hypothetical protein
MMEAFASVGRKRLSEHIIGMPIRIDFIKRSKTLEEISKVSCDIAIGVLN